MLCESGEGGRAAVAGWLAEEAEVVVVAEVVMVAKPETRGGERGVGAGAFLAGLVAVRLHL